MGFFDLIIITPQSKIDNHTVFIIISALNHDFFFVKRKVFEFTRGKTAVFGGYCNI